jgi:hypothetical protein
VASAGPQFSAVMLQDGVSAWTATTESLIEASPVLSGDVVYTIEVRLLRFRPITVTNRISLVILGKWTRFPV